MDNDKDILHSVKRIHFVGIGGSGMSPLAEILHTLGYTLTGSDVNESDNVNRLRSLGIPIQMGHAAENVGNAELVVFTAAVNAANPELAAARERGIPLLERAKQFCLESGGAFDPTIAPLTELWSITSDHPHLPSQQELDALLPLVDVQGQGVGVVGLDRVVPLAGDHRRPCLSLVGIVGDEGLRGPFLRGLDEMGVGGSGDQPVAEHHVIDLHRG